MLTLSTFWKKDHSNTQVCLLKRAWAFYMKPRAVSMLGIVLEKTWGFANIKVQTSLCIGSLINTFAIRLLENIVLLNTHIYFQLP